MTHDEIPYNRPKQPNRAVQRQRSVAVVAAQSCMSSSGLILCSGLKGPSSAASCCSVGGVFVDDAESSAAHKLCPKLHSARSRHSLYGSGGKCKLSQIWPLFKTPPPQEYSAAYSGPLSIGSRECAAAAAGGGAGHKAPAHYTPQLDMICSHSCCGKTRKRESKQSDEFYGIGRLQARRSSITTPSPPPLSSSTTASARWHQRAPAPRRPKCLYPILHEPASCYVAVPNSPSQYEIKTTNGADDEEEEGSGALSATPPCTYIAGGAAVLIVPGQQDTQSANHGDDDTDSIPMGTVMCSTPPLKITDQYDSGRKSDLQDVVPARELGDQANENVDGRMREGGQQAVREGRRGCYRRVQPRFGVEVSQRDSEGNRFIKSDGKRRRSTSPRTRELYDAVEKEFRRLGLSKDGAGAGELEKQQMPNTASGAPGLAGGGERSKETKQGNYYEEEDGVLEQEKEQQQQQAGREMNGVSDDKWWADGEMMMERTNYSGADQGEQFHEALVLELPTNKPIITAGGERANPCDRSPRCCLRQLQCPCIKGHRADHNVHPDHSRSAPLLADQEDPDFVLAYSTSGPSSSSSSPASPPTSPDLINCFVNFSNALCIAHFSGVIQKTELSLQRFCSCLVRSRQKMLLRSTSWPADAAAGGLLRSKHKAEVIAELLRPMMPDVSFSSPQHFKYGLQACISRTVFKHFEAPCYGRVSARVRYPAHVHRQFAFLKEYYVLESLHKCAGEQLMELNEDFDLFCHKKLEAMKRKIGWVHRWPSKLLQAFLLCLKNVWIAHKLAFAFEKPAALFFVKPKAQLDLHYMNPLADDHRVPITSPIISFSTDEKVQFSVFPGFALRQGVVHSTVYLKPKSPGITACQHPHPE